MIRILVVEDEALVAQRLIRQIKEVNQKALEIHHEKNIANALQFLSNHSIDLLFLDLNLHGKSGFDLLKQLTAQKFHTIIVSAYTEKALEAFEYGVLDFVGKPFSQARLSKALSRFFEGTRAGGGSMVKLAIQTRGVIKFVPVANIRFVKASGVYTELHCGENQVHVYDKPLNALMQLLPASYYRIHKSYAVDQRKVKGIRKIRHNTFEVQLATGESLPLSRSSKQELQALLQQH